jgi:hypothetical protein
MNIRNKIENTDTFKTLPVFKQNIYKRSDSIKNLNEQYILAQKQGYEVWRESYKPCDTEDKIIKELLNQQIS